MQTAPLVLSKACRSKLAVDPILYIPATRTYRSRLIRWRMGWLPGRPVTCVCTRDHTSRRHFLACKCDAIPSSVYDLLPHPLQTCIFLTMPLTCFPSMLQNIVNTGLLCWNFFATLSALLLLKRVSLKIPTLV